MRLIEEAYEGFLSEPVTARKTEEVLADGVQQQFARIVVEAHVLE